MPLSRFESELELRVLMVEDSVHDGELLSRALRDLRRELRTLRVDNEGDLRRALVEFDPHVVLSDYTMPGFSGHEALRLVSELAPTRPFIFVSGTIGEEAAIEAVRRGAADYVFKDNLRRLATAVENALRKSAEREARERMERQLRESEERFRAIVESTEDWVWEMTPDGRLTYSNASVSTLLGFTPAELAARNVLDLIEPDDRAEVARALPRHVAERSGWRHWMLRWRHRDGRPRLIESTARPLLDDRGDVVGFRGIDRDMTLRMRQEVKIRQLARFHAVLSALGNAVLRTRDVDSLLDRACQIAFEQGQFRAAVVALPDPGRQRLRAANRCGDARVLELIESIGPADIDSEFARGRPLVRAFLGGKVEIESDFSRADLPAEIRARVAQAGVAALVALPIGSPPWAVLSLFSSHPNTFDTEEVALLERIAADLDYARDFIAKSERLQYLAYRSLETGLPNRAAFEGELAQRLAVGEVAIGALDIVRSGPGGDARGRRFRDRLLIAIGDRLAASAPAGTFLAHVGGDDFMFASADQRASSGGIEAVESWLRDCAERPVVIDGEQIHFALRAGVALAPEHGRDFDALEHAALAALGEGARHERVVTRFSEELSERATRRRLLERELRSALAEERFTLFLQPKFDAGSRRLTGAEALLRWRHPVHGLISPAEFVPVLEETGLIIPAGQWVLSTAAAILRRWREQGWSDYRIAVNVSARELRQQGYVEGCRAALGPDPDHGLDVEVTESLLIEDMALHVSVLERLRELGCRIAIDDFGTGYSSLNYLSKLPVDVLKIDQTFTAQVASSPDTLALVTNIISLAHSLNLEVIAEGVEEEEQEKLLRLLRCNQLQGYLLGRPVAVDEFERLYLH
jgi:PAS domain S-box-containing protein